MSISHRDLIAMFPEANLGFELECEFTFDEGTFAVSMTGFYTAPELLAIVREIAEANKVFAQCPRGVFERQALIAKNEAEKAARENAETLRVSGYECEVQGSRIVVKDPVRSGIDGKIVSYEIVTLNTDDQVWSFLEDRS